MNVDDLAVDFAVDDEMIRCGNTLHFPRVCVFTGETTALEPRHATFFYCPLWVYVLVPFTFGLATLLYFFMRKRCEIVYYLSPNARRETNWKRFAGTALILLGITGLFLFLSIDFSNQLLMLIPAIIMIVGAIVAMRGESCPIKAAKADRTYFWLRGCRRPFFDQIKSYMKQS